MLSPAHLALMKALLMDDHKKKADEHDVAMNEAMRKVPDWFHRMQLHLLAHGEMHFDVPV